MVEPPCVRNYSIGFSEDGRTTTDVFNDLGYQREQTLTQLRNTSNG